MIFNNIFKKNNPIKTRTLYPYEKEYRSLIGKTITLEYLNDYTERWFNNYMRHINFEQMVLNQIPTFEFNNLNNDKIIELSFEQELTPDDRVLYFDVIEYDPSDYKLCLGIELLDNGKIKIKSVSVES